jgi:hypothetical protein
MLLNSKVLFVSSVKAEASMANKERRVVSISGINIY